MKQLVVVDDHPMTRTGVANLIRSQPGLAVCGEAGTAKAALALIEKKHPDLVLCDLSLTERSGLELIKDLHVLRPDIPVLVFSMHYESLYAERVLRAGARGYIMKNEGAAKLINAIRQVLQGNIYLSEAMQDRALHRFARGPAAAGKKNTAALSDRELEVFELIGQAVDTRQIARQLQVSLSTIATHRAHIKEKLGLATSTQLVHAAIEWVNSSK